MSEKRCTKCGGPGPFNKDNSRVDGLACRCKECKKSYRLINKKSERQRVQAWRASNPEALRSGVASWRAKNQDKYKGILSRYRIDHKVHLNSELRSRCEGKKEFIDSLKLGKPCTDCGVDSLPPFCMDFDHITSGKRDCVSQMTGYSIGVILEEVAKCELVCANCHKIRTVTRRGRSANSYRAELQAKFDLLKSEPCTDCGTRYHPSAMEFDHVRGSKSECVSQIWNWDKVLEEVAKCDLVCSVCHRIRTESRKSCERAA